MFKGKKAKFNLILTAVIIAVGFNLFFALTALAAEPDLGVTAVGGATGLNGSQDIRVTIGKIIQVALGFLGVVAIGIVLYGGFLYMTSGGDPGKTEIARKWLINGAIGAAIILSAFAITTFVMSRLQTAINGTGGEFTTGGGPGGFLPAGSGNAFQVNSISPAGDNFPIDSTVKVSFTKPVDGATVNAANIKITKLGTKELVTNEIKPIEVKEINGVGADILSGLLVKDNFKTDVWAVCSTPKPDTKIKIGNTPMVVKYDLSNYDLTDASMKLVYKVMSSSNVKDGVKFDITCGGVDNPGAISVKKGFIAPTVTVGAGLLGGGESMELPKACFDKLDETYLQFTRQGVACAKFDYLWLESQKHEYVNAGAEVPGKFEVVGSEKNKVKFTPDADCAESACGGKKCFEKNTKYQVKILPDKIKSNSGAYTIACGASDKCSAIFSTNDQCDIEGPVVSFLAPAPKAKVSIDDEVEIKINSVDLAGVSGTSLFIDQNFLEEATPEGDATPKDYTASFFWNTGGLELKKYNLKAISEDTDTNSGQAENIVSVLPKYCFDSDGKLICDADGKHPECGACDGAVCSKSDDCAGTCKLTCADKDAKSCTVNADCAPNVACVGKCVSAPIITGVKPDTGAPGGLVTIIGSGFQKYDAAKSKIYFSGADGTYLEAELGCAKNNSWLDYQIVARVPIGAMTGPIKVQNASLETDTTDDDDGWKDDFTIDPKLQYPGLCAVIREGCNPTCSGAVCPVCDEGQAGDYVKAAGENFGKKDEDDFVFFGDIKSLFGANFSWQDKAISGIQTPMLDNGSYNVAIGKDFVCEDLVTKVECVPPAANCVCSGAYSNPVQYKLVPSANQPQIDSIKPGSAAIGQMITVSGKYFGKDIGYVEVTREIDGQPYSWPAGLGCGPENWSDNEIVIKVPENIPAKINSLNKEIYSTDFKVVVYTSKGLASKPFGFEIIAGAAMPGVCSLKPNNGPSGTKVEFIGEHFGNSSDYLIKFSKTGGAKIECPAGISYCDPDKVVNCQCVKKIDPGITASQFGEWTETSVKNVSVPVGAVSGGAYFEKKSDQKISNAVQYNVGSCKANTCGTGQTCCGDGVCKDKCSETYTYEPSQYMWMLSTGPLPVYPHVLERSCVAGIYPQSPSPYKDTIDACPNGLISATFNLPMNVSSFNKNIVIKRCVKANEKCDFAKCGQNADCVEKTVDVFSAADAADTNYGVNCVNTLDASACSLGQKNCACTASTADKITSFSLLNSGFLPENKLLETPDNKGVVEKIILKDDDFRYDLFKNTWYEITIKGGASGVKAKEEPMQDDYVWSFQTKSETCVPDNLLMKPLSGLIDDLYGTQKYVVSGQYKCQEIALNNEDWKWGVVKIADADKVKFAGYACSAEGEEKICADGEKHIGYFGLVTENSNKIPLETEPLKPIAIYAEATPGDKALKSVFDKLYKEAFLEITFKDPKVVYNYPTCNEACINAEIGADFNIEMDKNSFKPETVKLYSCFAADCVNLTEVSLLASQINYVWGESADGKIINRLKITPPDLLPNQFYRVVITSGVQSASLVDLTGLNYKADSTAAMKLDSYSWIFKTKNDLKKCEVNKVQVAPDNFISEKLGEKIEYWAEPYSSPDSCNAAGQLLNAFNYDWQWNSSKPEIAVISDYKSTLNPKPYCTDSCLTKGSTPFAAVCGNKIVEVGEECDDGNAVDGDKCSSKCLHEPVVNCKPEQLNGKDNGCCGDGFTSVDKGEECDQGCVYSDGNDKPCKPKGIACTAGCLAAGTSKGFTCGNGIVEPGEDADFGALNKTKGLDAKCLYVGSTYKSTDAAAQAICGNGVFEAGEECEAISKTKDIVCNQGKDSDCSIDNNPFCSKTCTWVGFTACKTSADKNCCGNGILEGYPGGKNYAENKDEECEATIKDGKAVFPAWCSNKCLNLGSSYKYEKLSYCNNGSLESGEDEQCDEKNDAAIKVNPYQVATIANQVSWAALLFDDKTKYSVGLTEISASPNVDEGVDVDGGKTNLMYRTKECPEKYKYVGIDFDATAPYEDQTNVCLNPLIYITLGNKVDYSMANIKNNIQLKVGTTIVDTTNTIAVNELGKTIITLAPKGLLDTKTDYVVEISNLKNLCGEPVGNITTNFETGTDVCLLDNVMITPPEPFITESNKATLFKAFAKSGDQPIASMPGVYDWEWSWAADNDSVVTALPNVKTSENTATTGNKNGTANLTAEAKIITDTITEELAKAQGKPIVSTKGLTKSDTAKITVYICDNLWSPTVPSDWDSVQSLLNNGKYVSTYIYEKEYKAGLFYCRDFGDAGNTTDDLPKLNIVSGKGAPNCANGNDDDNDGLTDTVNGQKFQAIDVGGAFPKVDDIVKSTSKTITVGDIFQSFDFDPTANKVTYTFKTMDNNNNPIEFISFDIKSDETIIKKFEFPKTPKGLLKVWMKFTDTDIFYDVYYANDLSDPDCVTLSDTEGVAVVVGNECTDKLDNDNNGLTDALDPKCGTNDKSESIEIKKQYFFVRDQSVNSNYDQSADMISLRIFENPEALPAGVWYQRYAPNPAASTVPMKIDCQNEPWNGEFCYIGEKDGTTVYVAASNVDGSNIYNNVYILSYSKNANEATKNIYSQMINLLRFNFGLAVSKIALIRDTQRLSDMVMMRLYLNEYIKTHGNVAPQLESGSYVRGQTFSVWPSWQNELGKALKQTLPKDPLNHFKWENALQSYTGAVCEQGLVKNYCPLPINEYQCVVPSLYCVNCPKDYDMKTCYNSQSQKFSDLYSNNENENPVYEYNVNATDKSKYELKFRFEIGDKPQHKVAPGFN